ncbi:MAG TPA: sodium transporter, partial [Parvularcula sp.]|nr:sodium transporter [Parvularcula sp.]
IVAIFLLGMFVKRATEIGAIGAVVGSFALSIALKLLAPEMPFIDRVGVVFIACLAIGVALSYLQKPASEAMVVDLGGVSFRTSAGFNIGAVAVTAILIAFYATWW